MLSQCAEKAIAQRAANLVETQFLSWVRANPFLTGIHYISAMECGLRILAVCHALDLVRARLEAADQVWPALLDLVWNHAELIRKRLSIHSSAGNHTVAEAAGLLYAGILFPEVRPASIWHSLGLSLLEQEASHQILSDGGGAEQGFWYLRFISDLYGLVDALLRHSGQSVPIAIGEAFQRSRSFLGAFSRNFVETPQIGDGDDGYALSPSLTFPQKLEASSCPVTTFDAAGYSIIRDDSNDVRIIFDHGPLGMAPCYAHGHADALSIILSVGGQEVLIDPGTFTYTGDQQWRTYFRGTRAHNTVVVDSLDQAVQETAFMWSQPYHAELMRREETSNGTIVLLARHDGYKKRAGVMHWRAVLYMPPLSWLIWDRLLGVGSHHLELNWHIGIEPALESDMYVLRGSEHSFYMSVDGGVGSLHRGETTPIKGWWSRHYGIKEPLTTLQVQYTGMLPHTLVTRIWSQKEAGMDTALLKHLAAIERIADEACTR
jgi:hypothetical protein